MTAFTQACPRVPDWLRPQCSLRTLFVATTAVGVACWMFKTGRAELALATAIPFAEGFAVGDMVSKRKQWDGNTLAKAIVRFPIMVWVVLWLGGTIELLASPPGNGAAAPIQGFALATLYLPGMLIYGGPAGIVGVIIGQALRKAEPPAMRNTTDVRP